MVRVPVLSEQMTLAQPRVSTAGSFFTMAPRSAIRPTPRASTMVTMEDSASVALFTPSKMMAMEWDMNPTAILKATSSALPIMP